MGKSLQTEEAPAAIGPYAQARWAGNLLFVSGQIGLEPTTQQMVPGGVEEQARQSMLNVGAILEAAGLTWSDVVKATIFLKNIEDFAAVNRIYASFFSGEENFPARVCVAVEAMPKDALVEVETVACRE